MRSTPTTTPQLKTRLTIREADASTDGVYGFGDEVTDGMRSFFRSTNHGVAKVSTGP